MDDPFGYVGKRVIVTGVDTPVGAATASLLVGLGAEVHVSGVARPAFSGFASFNACAPDDVDTLVEIARKVGHVVNALFVTTGPAPAALVAAVEPLVLPDSAIAALDAITPAPVRSNAVCANGARADATAFALAFLNSPRAAVDGVALALSPAR